MHNMSPGETLHNLLMDAGLPLARAAVVANALKAYGFVYVNHRPEVDEVLPAEGGEVFRMYHDVAGSAAFTSLENDYSEYAYRGYLLIPLPVHDFAAEVARQMKQYQEEWSEDDE